MLSPSGLEEECSGGDRLYVAEQRQRTCKDDFAPAGTSRAQKQRVEAQEDADHAVHASTCASFAVKMGRGCDIPPLERRGLCIKLGLVGVNAPSAIHGTLPCECSHPKKISIVTIAAVSSHHLFGLVWGISLAVRGLPGVKYATLELQL